MAVPLRAARVAASRSFHLRLAERLRVRNPKPGAFSVHGSRVSTSWPASRKAETMRRASFLYMVQSGPRCVSLSGSSRHRARATISSGSVGPGRLLRRRGFMNDERRCQLQRCGSFRTTCQPPFTPLISDFAALPSNGGTAPTSSQIHARRQELGRTK